MSTQLALGSGETRAVSIESRMEQAFLDYSMSVIVGRALPDVRDGLKPVQRRILYTMFESGLRPDRPYRKCASAVGEVMKKYHPHGDSSIYDALVRMAQDFSIREPLVDGHGNFGSVDGDSPAAMRYTEARLSPLGAELLAGIDEDTVDFVDNYDGYEQEPVVLPGRFPNLLVNGASGIAVGMATNMAPHNLGETISACLALIEDPELDLDGLMEHVPAPDFPTGARIVASEGIREAYETGKGAVTMEAVATTEVRTGNLPRIIVTEIPFQVNKATLLEKIAELVKDRTLDDVRDLRDESSRDGMRIVIELKRGTEPAEVLEQLYTSTDLRSNFNVNAVALVDAAPQRLGLRDMLTHYLDHQREVVTRRTRHRLDRAEHRAHVLEGLLAALDDLDAVIDLIRSSESSADARLALVERFEMTDVQAQAVLDMRLRRLAALERAELTDEYEQLQERIAGLTAILEDEERLDEVLADELAELRRVHATPRRSRVVEPGISAEDVLAGGSRAGFEAREVTVLVTGKGYVKPLARRRTTPAHRHAHDPLAAVVRCTTDDTLLLIDEEGTGYPVELFDVPVAEPKHRGTKLAEAAGVEPRAPITAAVVLPRSGDTDLTLATVSARGQVKRSGAAEYVGTRRTHLEAAGRSDGDDRIVAAVLCRDDDQLMLAHSGGYVVRFPAGEEVRTMGRGASGVIGMRVPDDERIVAASAVPGGQDDGHVLTVGADATIKSSPLADYSVQGRGGKGLITGVDDLRWCGVATDLHLAADEPTVVRPVDVPEAGRSARGTRLDLDEVRSVVAEQGGPDDGDDR